MVAQTQAIQERHYIRSDKHVSTKRHTNITETERFVSLTLGSALAVYGLQKRTAPGLLVSGLGALLVMRGVSGHSYAYERFGLESVGQPVHVTKSVTINRSPQEVYAFWRQFEKLPRFMRHIESVEPIGESRYHWVAHPALPHAPVVEWDSELVEERPNELLAWKSLPGSAIESRGRVELKPAPGDRGTEVHVTMDYKPAMGVTLAHFVAPVTAQVLKEEIRRLKHVLEAGEYPSVEGQPAARAA